MPAVDGPRVQALHFVTMPRRNQRWLILSKFRTSF
jgi:hypothetical protein